MFSYAAIHFGSTTAAQGSLKAPHAEEHLRDVYSCPVSIAFGSSQPPKVSKGFHHLFHGM